MKIPLYIKKLLYDQCIFLKIIGEKFREKIAQNEYKVEHCYFNYQDVLNKKININFLL